MKMNEKTKKGLIVAGGTAVIIALVIAIGSQFGNSSKEADVLPSSTEVLTEIEVTTEVKPTTEKKEITVAPTTESRETEMETLPSQTDQPEQSIQTEPTKPAAPSEEQKKNPQQKPSGETVAEVTAVKHEEAIPETAPPVVEEVPETAAAELAETSPATDSAKNSETQGGNANAGIYVPGFGWVEGNGDSYGTTLEDMYENGNKIGIMN